MMAALGLCTASGARLRRLGRAPMESIGLILVLFGLDLEEPEFPTWTETQAFLSWHFALQRRPLPG